MKAITQILSIKKKKKKNRFHGLQFTKLCLKRVWKKWRWIKRKGNISDNRRSVWSHILMYSKREKEAIFHSAGVSTEKTSTLMPAFAVSDCGRLKAPVHFLTRSCSPISHWGKPVGADDQWNQFKTDVFGPLHWFPMATDLIARPSQKVNNNNNNNNNKEDF